MTFGEKKVLSQVTVLLVANAINVRWENQVLRDGTVISTVPHRKAYGKGQREEFLAEVEGAESYVNQIDWAPVQA